MKKLFFALAGVILVASSAVAQNYEKNLYGVRAGLNVASLLDQGMEVHSKTGFHIAGVYQRLLTESLPLYLETGLQLSQKGYKVQFYERESYNAMYLEIPVMVNYKFYIKDKVAIYPSFGVYYALGIGGKYKGESMNSEEYGTEKYDMFGSKGFMKRSDFGLRFSATAEWRKFAFSLGYEFGFVDVAKNAEPGSSDYDDEYYGGGDYNFGEMKTGNIFISIGYNF